jgi:hypothetical protein
MPLGHWSLLFFLCFGGGSFLLLRVTYPCAHCPFCKPNNRTKPVRLHRRDTTPRPVPRNETKGSTRTTTLFTYEEIKGHTAMVPSLPFDANPAASREREVISMWAHPVAFHLCGSSANGAPTVQPLLLREEVIGATVHPTVRAFRHSLEKVIGHGAPPAVRPLPAL